METTNQSELQRGDFAGLRVAITGGTSGLGLAFVQELHARGARIAFVARNPSSIERSGHPGTWELPRRLPKETISIDRHANSRATRRPRRTDQQRIKLRTNAAAAIR